MTCEKCESDPCTCRPSATPHTALPPLYQGAPPLQYGPYITMEEALAERPDLLTRLKRVLPSQG